MRFRSLLLAASIAALLPAAPVLAQTQNSVVVSSCGSKSYTAGQPAANTQDTTGKFCTSTSGGGGGNVTIVAPLGTGAPALGVTTTLDTTDAAALQSIVTNTGGAIPAGTALIGKVGIDQTTPGTTNNVTISTNVGTLPLIQATATNAITSTSATTTRIITLSGSTKTYITHYELVVSGAGTVNFISGTGGTCGTNTAFLTGATGHPMSFSANGGISAGSGLGPIMIAAAGQEVCIVTTGAVDTSGLIAFAQF